MKSIYIVISILFLNLISTSTLFSQDLLFKGISPTEFEIILLGEQTHGDGAVFDKKLEMIKDLHDNYGYNLLVFESGMYDNFKANELYKSQKEEVDIFKQSVGWLYTTTEVFQKLLNYLETHPELKILGFDSQESNLFEEYFLNDFKSLCSKNNIVISDEDYIEIEKTMVVRDFEKYAFNKKDSTNLYNNINAVIDKIDQIPKNDIETKVIVQTFKSAFSDLDFGLKSLQKEKIAIQNPRDKQMAENLIFIKDLYPNEKIIGWGASYHFANKLNEFEYTLETENYIKKQIAVTDSIHGDSHTNTKEEIAQIKDLKYAVPMGQILKEKYGSKLFSLAFTSYEGFYFDFLVEQISPILQPPANSIESDFKNQDIKTALYVLNDIPYQFYSSALGYIPLSANWENIFDGIYYIEKMYPPKYIEYDNEKIKTVTYKGSSISGSIIDDDTSEPINYADIYYSNLNSSTISNSNGQFNIAREENTNGYLIFSAIGYESDSISTNSITKQINIRLKKSKDDIILNEVVVIAERVELSAEEIIEKARNNIEINYTQTPYNQKFLFKVSQFNTKDSLSIGEEAFIKTYNKKGINGSNKPENNIFGEIEHLRTNTDVYEKSKWYHGIGSLWAVLNRDIILSKTNVLYRTTSYDLKKQKILHYEGQEVYQINFTNNSPGSYSTGFGYPAPTASSGSIYIDTENYAVLKYEHKIERAEYKTKKSKNLVKQNHKIVETYKNVNGRYFFNVLEFSTDSVVSSLEHEYLYSSFNESKLISNNIETSSIHILNRPLVELKKGYQKKSNDGFWKEKPIDFTFEIKG
ncbi:carboxypeptidase-like regulatory domain-containing protein [Maribacter sp. 1_MG-2023]|uniref:carboxypeptidase-like regulatory domain-containing protein n=1 Tax=Maribacter sp. 1_MG-2023 TaxID=3062677 RepID=UPI0026E25ADA|nr:carboxypeptidase-like regulatory domain-containing protein [Maribacter sp. 1_MG-2023]MDO6473505.1 carboxypeptidase-like regulatory domain-containing protein [Maribacter sp. 1_MG-2023]